MIVRSPACSSPPKALRRAASHAVAEDGLSRTRVRTELWHSALLEPCMRTLKPNGMVYVLILGPRKKIHVSPTSHRTASDLLHLHTPPRIVSHPN